jgi:hypothetical protein
MFSDSVCKSALKGLKPQTVRLYLSAQGWTVHEKTSKFSIYRNKELNEEVLVPNNRSFKDYVDRLEDLMNVLSFAEERTKNEILTNIMYASAVSVIEYRYESSSDEYGVIPIMDMNTLLNTQKNLTNYAYRDLVDWKKSYPSSRWRGSTLSDEVRLGQTTAGSYIVRFLYPSVAKMDQETLADGPIITDDTMEKVCDKIISSLGTIVEYAEAGKDEIEDDKKISYNFVSSVSNLKMDDVSLEVNKTDMSRPKGELRDPIPITNKIFSNIFRIEENMRPPELSKEREFVGWFVRVSDKSSYDEDAPIQLALRFGDDDGIYSSARLDLDDSHKDLIYDAMRNNKAVKLNGTLKGTGQNKRIDDPSGLRIV